MASILVWSTNQVNICSLSLPKLLVKLLNWQKLSIKATVRGWRYGTVGKVFAKQAWGPSQNPHKIPAQGNRDWLVSPANSVRSMLSERPYLKNRGQSRRMSSIDLWSPHPCNIKCAYVNPSPPKLQRNATPYTSAWLLLKTKQTNKKPENELGRWLFR